MEGAYPEYYNTHMNSPGALEFYLILVFTSVAIWIDMAEYFYWKRNI
jgi:hypothetical protein